MSRIRPKFGRLGEAFDRIRRIISKDIWDGETLRDRSLRGRIAAVLRVAAMTWNGVIENSLASRAGALSYSSMLGLAPLIAIVVMFSSIVLEKSDPNFAVNQLNRAIVFVAPQLRQIRTTPPEASPAQANAAQPQTTEDGEPALEVNPEIVNFLNSIITASQSKAIGILGAVALIVIVIQLFSTIENAFNSIWGVRRGRNWMLRIVFYWTAVTLGAVLAFSSLTLMSGSSVVSMIDNLPLGPEIRRLIVIMGPVIAGVVLAVLLTVFYKFIPNTSVGWWPAVAGGTTVVLLLNLNNYLAFLYINTVLRQQSLFGPFVLPIVLMFGLYVFWLVVLLGGQITYAVQNANYRSSTIAWHGLNYHARQGLALLVMTLIARRFRGCERAYSAPELSELIKIPTQILNACLGRLMSLNLIARIPPDDASAIQEYRFQPARPLDRITLPTFKELFDGLGEGPTLEVLNAIDPVVHEFHQRLQSAINTSLGSETLGDLVDRLPRVAHEDLESDKTAAVSPAG